MLTHTYKYKPPSKIKVCNHQTDTQPFVLCGLMSDLVICKFQTTSRHSKSRLFDLNRRIKSELESFFAALLQYAFS